MQKDELPWMKLYVRDWLAEESVALMTLAAKGAYMDLMCRCWMGGSIPAEPSKLARLLGVTESDFEDLWLELEPHFVEESDGRLYHPRVREERAESEELYRKRSEAGRKGAAVTNAKRWGDGTADGGDATSPRHTEAEARQGTGEATPDATERHGNREKIHTETGNPSSPADATHRERNRTPEADAESDFDEGEDDGVADGDRVVFR